MVWWVAWTTVAVHSACTKYLNHTDFPGNDIRGVSYVESVEACCTQCTRDSACNAFTFKTTTSAGHPICWLKSTNSTSHSSAGSTSGIVTTHSMCTSDWDCSLAGECQAKMAASSIFFVKSFAIR